MFILGSYADAQSPHGHIYVNQILINNTFINTNILHKLLLNVQVYSNLNKKEKPESVVNRLLGHT